MKKVTRKQLALKINPSLASCVNTDKSWSIWDESSASEIIRSPNVRQAWADAYDKLALEQFKVGDQLVIIDCLEASSHKGRVFTCRYPSYKTCSGDFAVFLEGLAGSWCCEFLRKATDEEIQLHLAQNQPQPVA